MDDDDLTALTFEDENMPDPKEPEKHSPAELLALVLISLSEGTDPEDGQAWPIFYSELPDSPDAPIELIGISTTTPVLDGVSQTSGRTVLKHGVQVRVRSQTSDRRAFAKAAQLQGKLSCNYNIEFVASAGEPEEQSYKFHNATLQNGPARAGRSDEGRYDYTLNYTLALTENTP